MNLIKKLVFGKKIEKLKEMLKKVVNANGQVEYNMFGQIETIGSKKVRYDEFGTLWKVGEQEIRYNQSRDIENVLIQLEKYKIKKI